jgi:hypothetical protein
MGGGSDEAVSRYHLDAKALNSIELDLCLCLRGMSHDYIAVHGRGRAINSTSKGKVRNIDLAGSSFVIDDSVDYGRCEMNDLSAVVHLPDGYERGPRARSG